MAHVRDATLTTNKTAEESLRAGQEALTSAGLKVRQTGADTLEAEGGGQFNLLVFGALTPLSMMPAHVDYRVTDDGTSRRIQIHTQSQSPLFIYTWKFEKRAETLSQQITQAVSSALGAQATPPTPA